MYLIGSLFFLGIGGFFLFNILSKGDFSIGNILGACGFGGFGILIIRNWLKRRRDAQNEIIKNARAAYTRLMEPNNTSNNKKYSFLGKYIFEIQGDLVYYLLIDEGKLFSGKGALKQKYLMLLYPDEVSNINDMKELRVSLGIDRMDEWDLSEYIVHSGKQEDKYPILNAIDCKTGKYLDPATIKELMDNFENLL